MTGMSLAQSDYMRDVLGVSSWIRPESAIAPKIVEGFIAAARYYVYTPNELPADEAQLLSKMMTALKIQNWSKTDRLDEICGFIFIFGAESWKRAGLTGEYSEHLGRILQNQNSQILISHSLSSMCGKVTPDQQAMKRQTWEHLQLFSREWSRV